MILALLLAAQSVGPLDIERAFARDAQQIGQWTAFRKYADRDAVMFAPHAVWARNFLRDRRDPPKSIRWQPAVSFVSCDGHTAVNSGPWFLPNGRVAGSFTTVWQQTDRWRWVYDAGGPVTSNLGGKPRVHRASCSGRAPGAPIIPPPPLTPKQARTTHVDNGRGESADKTLGWDWKVARNGDRHFRVYQWNGVRYDVVVNNFVPAR